MAANPPDTGSYLATPGPITAVVATAFGAAAVLYPPLRDRSDLVPVFGLVIWAAVTTVVLVHHVGWKKVAVQAATTNPTGVISDLSAIADVVHAPGHSPAEVAAAVGTAVSSALAAAQGAPAAPPPPPPAAAGQTT